MATHNWDVDLYNLLPEYHKEIPDFDEYTDTVEQTLSDLTNNLTQIVLNFFILTADEATIKRYEQLLNIFPEDGTDLDTRRYRVLLAWQRRPPYTIYRLREILQALVGADNWTITQQYEDGTMQITVETPDEGLAREVNTALIQIIPTHIDWGLTRTETYDSNGTLYISFAYSWGVVMHGYEEYVEVESIQINPATAEMDTGTTMIFTVTFTPNNATDMSVTYESSDPDILSITNTGIATAINSMNINEEVTITATSVDSGVTSTATVHVYDFYPTEITLDKTEARVDPGESITLTATTGPDYIKYPEGVVWEIDQETTPGLVTLDVDGLTCVVTAGDIEGGAIIRCYSAKYDTVYAEFSLTVFAFDWLTVTLANGISQVGANQQYTYNIRVMNPDDANMSANIMSLIPEGTTFVSASHSYTLYDEDEEITTDPTEAIRVYWGNEVISDYDIFTLTVRVNPNIVEERAIIQNTVEATITRASGTVVHRTVEHQVAVYDGVLIDEYTLATYEDAYAYWPVGMYKELRVTGNPNDATELSEVTLGVPGSIEFTEYTREQQSISHFTDTWLAEAKTKNSTTTTVTSQSGNASITVPVRHLAEITAINNFTLNGGQSVTIDTIYFPTYIGFDMELENGDTVSYSQYSVVNTIGARWLYDKCTLTADDPSKVEITYDASRTSPWNVIFLEPGTVTLTVTITESGLSYDYPVTVGGINITSLTVYPLDQTPIIPIGDQITFTTEYEPPNTTEEIQWTLENGPFGELTNVSNDGATFTPTTSGQQILRITTEALADLRLIVTGELTSILAVNLENQSFELNVPNKIVSLNIELDGNPSTLTLFMDQLLRMGITFSSEDETMATVSADGVITPLQAGRVNIIISLPDYPAADYALEVYVPILIETITITQNVIPWLGYEGELEYTYTPANATETAISWNVTSGSATLYQDGRFIPYLNNGITVEARAQVGNAFSSFTPQVYAIENFTFEVLDSAGNVVSGNLDEGELYTVGNFVIDVGMLPPYPLADFQFAYPGTVTVEVDNTTHTFRPTSGGSMTIIGRYMVQQRDGTWVNYGNAATINKTVTPSVIPIESITILGGDSTNNMIFHGESIQYTATYSPNDATDNRLGWTTSGFGATNPVTVDQTGLVTCMDTMSGVYVGSTPGNLNCYAVANPATRDTKELIFARPTTATFTWVGGEPSYIGATGTLRVTVNVPYMGRALNLLSVVPGVASYATVTSPVLYSQNATSTVFTVQVTVNRAATIYLSCRYLNAAPANTILGQISLVTTAQPTVTALSVYADPPAAFGDPAYVQCQCTPLLSNTDMAGLITVRMSTSSNMSNPTVLTNPYYYTSGSRSVWSFELAGLGVGNYYFQATATNGVQSSVAALTIER